MVNLEPIAGDHDLFISGNWNLDEQQLPLLQHWNLRLGKIRSIKPKPFYTGLVFFKLREISVGS